MTRVIGRNIPTQGVKSTSNPMFESVLNGFCSKEAPFIFLPLTYIWRGHKFDLTLGYRYRNSEIYIVYTLLLVAIAENFKAIVQSV